MTATDAQVRIIMRERQQGKTQEQAAAKANLRSRKTVAKYERLGEPPSALQQPRQYRTRKNPFADDWETVTTKLQAAPTLEAKALFEWLCEQHPEKYQEGQLRTFQRHVAHWRALNQDQIAILEQVHRPGEVLQTDGVWLTELGVTLQGEPLTHLLIHSVLPYSNWEWGRIAQSESLAAVRLGVQSTLRKLGAVPQYHQTDNSSAATCHPGADSEISDTSQRGYTAGYLQLLDHYGLQARTTHRRRPQENGDVEAGNGGLKRALEQHLLLRGSRDFANLADYEAFVHAVMERRNRTRQSALGGRTRGDGPVNPGSADYAYPSARARQSGQPDPRQAPGLFGAHQFDWTLCECAYPRMASGRLLPIPLSAQCAPLGRETSSTTSTIGTSLTACCASPAASVTTATATTCFPAWSSGKHGSNSSVGRHPARQT